MIAIERKLDALAFLQQAHVTFLLNDRTPTEQLAARIEAYKRDAEAGERFDYAAFALDRATLPTILRAREAEADARAQFALAALGEVEVSLLKRAVSDYSEAGKDSADVENLRWIEGLIRDLAVGDRENLDALTGPIGMLQRNEERAQAEPPSPEIKLPRQRPAVDIDAIEVARQERFARETPITRLWDGRGL